MRKKHYSVDKYGRKVSRFFAGGDGDSSDDGSSDAGTGGADPGDGSAPGDAGDAGGNGGGIETLVSNTGTTTPPVTTTTTAGLSGPGNTEYTPQQIADALRAELGMRPGTTYWDMMQYGKQQYGLSPDQINQAYQDIQGSVTPYNRPTPGTIYSAPPTAYQPVRYTPQYDQYGQGIASLFGRGYSQYFQPPGLTGTYFFGSPGTAPTYVAPDGTNLGPGTQLTPGTQPPPITQRPPTQTIPGLTPAQQEQYNTLSEQDRARYLQALGLYNAPGNVQSDAALMRQYMQENNLNASDMAQLVGTTTDVITSYLGQANLTDAQLGRYTNLNTQQQRQYADLAAAYNAPGDTASDAAQMLGIMQQSNLSAADVAALTGIPINAVNDYLALATPTVEASMETTNTPQRVDYSQYAETPATGSTPESMGYSTAAQDIADAYLQAASAGVSGDQFLQYARDAGYTDAQLQAAYELLPK